MAEIQEEIKQEVVTYKSLADAIIVDDSASFEYASDCVLKGKTIMKRIEQLYADPKKKASEAHKSICAAEKSLLDPIKAQLDIIDKKMRGFLTAEKKRKDEEQRKLDEQRRADEQKERDRLMAEAKANAEKGNLEEAVKLSEEADTVQLPAQIAVAQVEKTTRIESGTVSSVSDVEITVIDKKVFIEWAIASDLMDEFIELKAGAIKTYMKTIKAKEIPGLKIEEIERPVFRTR